MRILLMSCHEILEYDELRLWHRLGYECYSLGAYTRPGGDDYRKRPPLPELPYNPHFIELADRYGKELHSEQLAGIDVVIVMHTPEFIEQNLPALKRYCAEGGVVVWRSIGQSVPWIESKIKLYRVLLGESFLVVRYSPLERNIQDYYGEDAVIRFAKDPNDFLHWRGTRPLALTFAQNFYARGDHLNYQVWEKVRSQLGPNMLFVGGPDNESIPSSLGLLSYGAQLSALAYARCYFYLGTAPAPYTLGFIEALFAGTPIVSVGRHLGNNVMYRQGNPNAFEVPDLFRQLELEEYTRRRWFSDSIDELTEQISVDLMTPDRVASDAQKRFAARHFSYEVIGQQWKDFFNDHG